MKVTPTDLPGVLLLEPRVFQDERGFFLESYNRRTFKEATGRDAEFVQDNQSFSVRNVLRGLHYQVRQPQGKLVAVMGARSTTSRSTCAAALPRSASRSASP